MTTETANALFGYFATLYDLNQNLITLCGVDIVDDSGQYEKQIQDTVQAIPRLVPYAYNKRNNLYTIIEHDGLLEYSNDLAFLKKDYETILADNYTFLENVKRIRNKFEHKMHGARIIAGTSSGDCVSFGLTYRVDESLITLSSKDIIGFTRSLNSLFSKIQFEVSLFAMEHGKVLDPYYRRLNRYSFTDFNLIYESNILKNVGAALFPF